MDLGTVSDLVVVRDRAELAAAGFGAGDAYLAGGSWVFSEPQIGTTRLIDLTGLDWPSLTTSEAGLEIAATCTLAEIATLAPTPTWPALALAHQCCDALRGSFKIWNVSTVGGNLCCALPAAPMTSLTAALDGTCLIWTSAGGEREVAVVDLVTGDGQTSLEPGEVVRSVSIPARALATKTAFRQASLTHLGRSAALLIGRLDPVDGAFVLTVTAATSRPVQVAFASIPTPAELTDALAARLPSQADIFDDVHGSPAWRRQLTGLLAQEIRDELAAAEPGFVGNGKASDPDGPARHEASA